MRFIVRVLLFSACLITVLPQLTSAAMIQLLGTGEPTPPMFNTNSLPPNPSLLPGGTFSDSNLNTRYNNIFGMPSPNLLPNLIFGETQDTVIMTLETQIAARNATNDFNTFQEFNFLITGDYWRIRTDLTYNPSTAVIIDPNDELTMKGFVQHMGKLSAPGIPHPGDDAAGKIIEYNTVLNAGNKLQGEAPLGGPLFAVGNFDIGFAFHPGEAEHQNFVVAQTLAIVSPDTNAQISFRDEFKNGYTGIIFGKHVIPEPSSLLLFGLGGLALGFLRKRP